MKRSELARDARFSTADDRRKNAPALDEIISNWTRELEPREAERLAQARGIPAHAVQNSVEFYSDAQVAHRGHFVELPHPVYGKTTVEGPRAKLSRTPAQARRAAPTLGQDNQYVLEKILGYNDEQIGDLVASGVLGIADALKQVAAAVDADAFAADEFGLDQEHYRSGDFLGAAPSPQRGGLDDAIVFFFA